MADKINQFLETSARHLGIAPKNWPYPIFGFLRRWP